MEICMNKKRVTAVILSAMMCMQIFTGCGAKNNAAAVEGGAGQTATESAQGAAGTVTEENAQTAEENVQGTAFSMMSMISSARASNSLSGFTASE